MQLSFICNIAKDEEKSFPKKVKKHRDTKTVFQVPSPPGMPDGEDTPPTVAPERSPYKEPPDVIF